MAKIIRNVKKSSEVSYDLIIVGGGIYGVMLSLEAVRKNLRPLLLEKKDFSSATSLNHLRTVHGGLRYLQTLDLHRFKESVSERKWFLKYFPQYVNPMPCLMPLYGKGLHRNIVMRAGLLLNDILSFNRNTAVNLDKHLPNGKILSPQETAEAFPLVEQEGLTGSALWYDGSIAEYQRLMTETLKLAVTFGATVLNYVEVTDLNKDGNTVTGVRAIDRVSGEELHFEAPVVINAAGPGCRVLAERFDRDHVPLFKKRLLLWNVLFRKEALSDHALGLSTVKGGGHTYFFHPWKNRLLVGTGELIVDGSDTETVVPDDAMDNFIADINKIVPGLNVSKKDIQRVYSGVLPAREDERLANREVLYDHWQEGGPKGLFSISGVKFTTSRLVAEKTLDRLFPQRDKVPHDKLIDRADRGDLSFDYDWEPESEADFDILKKIIEDEAVMYPDDLILRRTSLGDHPERALRILPKIRHLFDYDDSQWEIEVKKLEEVLT